MKIEEIPSDDRNEKINKYWFPLSKGYNRLIIVVGIIIMTLILISNHKDIDNFDDFCSYTISILFIEVFIYFAAIWVYRGFKDSRDKESQ